MRVTDARRAVADVAVMSVDPAGPNPRVAVGALVTTSEDGEEGLVFIAPHGGGSQLAGASVQVVTPQSPLGRALLGRAEGDSCELTLGGRERLIEVVAIA